VVITLSPAELIVAADRVSQRLVLMPNGCREWTKQDGSRVETYGKIGINGKTMGAHQVIWMAANGPVPIAPWGGGVRRLEVCHHCDNPPCCELSHLFIGSQLDNMRDQISKGRKRSRGVWTSCVRGHSFDTANTYVDPNNGQRACRTCNRDRMATYRAARP